MMIDIKQNYLFWLLEKKNYVVNKEGKDIIIF